uniref:Protein-export membrane protein SecG n=1 Tax=Candidatus Kentrum sp. LPFa TaxID=2126335 RepID=A0A450WPE2_9GAMM|nr:MAG: preprotein translocase subunit SecG [Candidatus Kentron sp. LPFa]
MQQFFMVIHVLTALAIIGLVLIQHGRGADAGAAFGSGASGTMFGSRGPATFLARITTILAATFFLTSVALAYIASHSLERESVVERARKDEPPTLPVEEEISIPPPPVATNASESQPESQKNPDIKPQSAVDQPAVNEKDASPEPSESGASESKSSDQKPSDQ